MIVTSGAQCIGLAEGRRGSESPSSPLQRRTFVDPIEPPLMPAGAAATLKRAPAFDLRDRRVFVAGHTGMVGRALLRRLALEGCDVLEVDSRVVDLRRQTAVERWMAKEQPDVVIIAAARVGGIRANSDQPADFLYDNLAIASNLIQAARDHHVAKLLFLGSSCIYPRGAAQPLREDALLTGPLEPTNQWYAIAKIAGVKLCQAYRQQHGCDFIAAMPTNLYGPHDNFACGTSHVISALMRRIHAAKVDRRPYVTIWGSGTPRREFMHVDDLADALVFLLHHYSDAEPINVGVGRDLTIAAVATLLAEIIGWEGRFVFDHAQPDGTPRKWMDTSRLAALGWTARTDIRDGLQQTYRWFRDHLDVARL